MPYPLRDISGRRSGKLRAISYDKLKQRWVCICDCGVEKLLKGGHFLRVKSCGCDKSSGTIRRNYKHGFAKRKNRHPEYLLWAGITKRCTNMNGSRFDCYGGRGITICDRWRYGDDKKSGFEYFIEDMGPRPSSKYSIDRIDNNGNYEPSNCKWATPKEQSRNRRGLRIVTYKGTKMIMSEAAELAGIDKDLVSERLIRGWSEDKALSTPPLPLFGGIGAVRFTHAK